MDLDELKAGLAAILDVQPETITDETSPKTQPAWDSMAALSIISFLDESVEGEISAEEAEKLTSFGAIVEFARRRGVLKS